MKQTHSSSLLHAVHDQISADILALDIDLNAFVRVLCPPKWRIPPVRGGFGHDDKVNGIFVSFDGHFLQFIHRDIHNPGGILCRILELFLSQILGDDLGHMSLELIDMGLLKYFGHFDWLSFDSDFRTWFQLDSLWRQECIEEMAYGMGLWSEITIWIQNRSKFRWFSMDTSTLWTCTILSATSFSKWWCHDLQHHPKCK